MIGVLNLYHVGVAGLVKRCGGEDQNRCVDQQRQAQRTDGVQPRITNGAGLAGDIRAVDPGLHHRRVQIQVMRHDGGTQNADGDVQRLLAAQHIPARPQSGDHIRPERLDEDQLDGKAAGDGRDQPEHYGFQTAKVGALQGQHDQRVEGSERHSCGDGNPQQQMKRQRRAQHFGQIGGDDRQFRQQPLALGDIAAIASRRQLRQITPGGDAKTRAEVLQDHA